jgi:hypothetical protein
MYQKNQMNNNIEQYLSKVKDRVHSILITADFLVRVTIGSPLLKEYQKTYQYRCENKKWSCLVKELRTKCKETGATEEKTNKYIYIVYEDADVIEETIVQKIIEQKFQCILEQKGLFRYGFGFDIL